MEEFQKGAHDFHRATVLFGSEISNEKVLHSGGNNEEVGTCLKIEPSVSVGRSELCKKVPQVYFMA